MRGSFLTRFAIGDALSNIIALSPAIAYPVADMDSFGVSVSVVSSTPEGPGRRRLNSSNIAYIVVSPPKTSLKQLHCSDRTHKVERTEGMIMNEHNIEWSEVLLCASTLLILLSLKPLFTSVVPRFCVIRFGLPFPLMFQTLKLTQYWLTLTSSTYPTLNNECKE